MLSRREFLMLAMYASVLAHTKSSIGYNTIIDAQSPGTVEFSSRDLNLLSSAIDVIIPATDGMPSATAAGAVRYLQDLCWQYPTIRDELHRFLDSLDRASVEKLHREFSLISEGERIQLAKSLEQQDATGFSRFVAYAYEAYYTRQRVLGLIACQNQLEEQG